MEEFELIAKTFQGLEEVLAQELTDLGANNIQIGRRMVSFTGDKAMMYKANFCLRTAVRVLKPILHFKASDADEVYNVIKSIEWSDYLDANSTFSVDAVVYSDVFRHSKFVAYRVKDAIADYFNEREGRRPSVRLNNPDLVFHIHIAHEECTLAFDSSGESLHRRGYRVETGAAPINEVLAAGMILLTGWRGECDFIDPMCGSGTLPIEAALIAKNIAPGVFRQNFAFEKWKDFDAELFRSIYDDDSAEREFNHKIYGYDADGRMVACARRNVKSAMMGDVISIECRDIKDFQEPAERAIMVVNPPYGERLMTDNLLGVYESLGERLKHAFQGNEAWVISSSYDCFDQIGLKASARIALYNGDLNCEFRKYEMFTGKYKGFRTEGNTLAKDFAPLKRKSRLTGLDGEERRRPQRNAVDENAPDADASMRRRRELESYFKTRTAKRIAAERAENADNELRGNDDAAEETQNSRREYSRDGERRGGNGGGRGYSSRGGERGKDGERRGGNGGGRGYSPRGGERGKDGERRGGNGGGRGYSSRGGERGKDGERRGGNGGGRGYSSRGGERGKDGERRGGNKPYLKGGKRTFTKRKGGDE